MDLGKAVKQGVVLENGSNGKGVGVADNPQIAAKSVGGFDGWNDGRREGEPFEAVSNVVDGDAVGVELGHDPVHERDPRHAVTKLLE